MSPPRPSPLLTIGSLLMGLLIASPPQSSPPPSPLPPPSALMALASATPLLPPLQILVIPSHPPQTLPQELKRIHEEESDIRLKPFSDIIHLFDSSMAMILDYLMNGTASSSNPRRPAALAVIAQLTPVFRFHSTDE